MITTEELNSWKTSIVSKKCQSEDYAQDFSQNIPVSRYYVHIAEVCGYQLDLINRLIADSEMHDRKEV